MNGAQRMISFTIPIYIINILGKIEKISIDFKNVYLDSSKTQPILFILSSGVDIM